MLFSQQMRRIKKTTIHVNMMDETNVEQNVIHEASKNLTEAIDKQSKTNKTPTNIDVDEGKVSIPYCQQERDEIFKKDTNDRSPPMINDRLLNSESVYTEMDCENSTQLLQKSIDFNRTKYNSCKDNEIVDKDKVPTLESNISVNVVDQIDRQGKGMGILGKCEIQVDKSLDSTCSSSISRDIKSLHIDSDRSICVDKTAIPPPKFVNTEPAYSMHYKNVSSPIQFEFEQFERERNCEMKNKNECQNPTSVVHDISTSLSKSSSNEETEVVSLQPIQTTSRSEDLSNRVRKSPFISSSVDRKSRRKNPPKHLETLRLQHNVPDDDALFSNSDDKNRLNLPTGSKNPSLDDYLADEYKSWMFNRNNKSGKKLNITSKSMDISTMKKAFHYKGDNNNSDRDTALLMAYLASQNKKNPVNLKLPKLVNVSSALSEPKSGIMSHPMSPESISQFFADYFQKQAPHQNPQKLNTTFTNSNNNLVNSSFPNYKDFCNANSGAANAALRSSHIEALDNSLLGFRCLWPCCNAIYPTVVLIRNHIKTLHLRQHPTMSHGNENLNIYWSEIYKHNLTFNDEKLLCKSFLNTEFSNSSVMSNSLFSKLNEMDNEYQKKNKLNVQKASKPKISPRKRSDVKKCRKVYGMDKRDLWCTQCKWKKACSRFVE